MRRFDDEILFGRVFIVGGIKDLTGEIFNDLTVVKYNRKETKGYGTLTYWECVCKCGNIIERSNKTLKNKNYSSCGCKNSRGESRKVLILFCGVGINDADYKLSERVINQDGVVHYTWRCPYYEVWASMLKRCYSKTYKKSKNRDPNSTVCEDWLRFSNFKVWMETQDWKDKYLDKDLRKRYSVKVYSPNTCCFVSNKINCFFTNCSRDMSPSFNSSCGKYVARINNPISKSQESLGYYLTKEKAIDVWFKRKTEIANILAKEKGLHQEVRDLLEDKVELYKYLIQ